MENTTGSLDTLRNLNRLRSEDSVERRAGVQGLIGLLDDPRMRKVFEHLYRHDSDPEVRAIAWQALAGGQPSVPGPIPSVAQESVPKAETPRAATPGTSARHASTRRESGRRKVQHGTPLSSSPPFLLNPRHARQIAQWQRQNRQIRQPSWRRGLIAGLLVLVIGLLWGAVLPDWGEWLALRRLGVTVPGEIAGAEASDGGRYSVFVQFSPDGSTEGALRWIEQRVSKSDYQRLEVGTLVDVRYVPDHPAVAQLQGVVVNHMRRNALTLAAAGLTALMGVGLILTRLLRGASAPSRRMLQGQVIACQGVEDEDGDYKVMLRYRFRSPRGRMITGQLGQVRNNWRGRKLPAPGTRVMIDYRSDSAYRLL